MVSALAVVAAVAAPMADISWPMGPAFLGAQEVEREEQVELLPDLGLVELPPRLRSALNLFPDVTGYRTARLFLREDGRMVLEIESVRDGVVHRERRTLTRDELTAFRSDLERRHAQEDEVFVETQEGRGGLVLGQTLLGLAYHGWAVPTSLGVSSAQVGVGTYLLTAGTAFYVPYRLTRNRTVAEVHRNVSMYGSTRGVVAGVLLGDLIMGDDRPMHSDNRDRIRIGGGVVGGAAGALAGFSAVDRWRPSEGDGALWGALGDAGLLGGALLAYALGPYAEEEVTREENGFTFTENRARNRRVGHALTVMGHGAGLAVGGWLSARRSHSPGDVRALQSAGLLGGQVGATLTRAVGVDEGRALAGSVVAGGVAGLALGDRFLAPQTLSQGEGLLVNAGHVAGGAVALGLTYLAVEELDKRPVLTLSTSTLGSLLGAGLVWRAVAADPGGGIGSRERPELGAPLDRLQLERRRW